MYGNWFRNGALPHCDIIYRTSENPEDQALEPRKVCTECFTCFVSRIGNLARWQDRKFNMFVKVYKVGEVSVVGEEYIADEADQANKVGEGNDIDNNHWRDQQSQLD